MNTVLQKSFLVTSLIISVMSSSVIADSPLLHSGSSNSESADLFASDLLPAEQAFVVFTTIESDYVTIHWRIAKGYYLYKEKMQFSVMDESDPISARQTLNPVKSVEWPSGILKEDPHFGWQEVFYGDIQIRLKIMPPPATAQKMQLPLQLRIDYQGCAEMGFCYPPMKTVVAPYG